MKPVNPEDEPTTAQKDRAFVITFSLMFLLLAWGFVEVALK